MTYLLKLLKTYSAIYSRDFSYFPCQYFLSSSFIFLITMEGVPTAIDISGMSLLTTESAPIIATDPMATTGRIVTFPLSRRHLLL